MKVPSLNPMTIRPKEAIELQKKWAGRVIVENKLGTVRLIAGADISIDKATSRGYGGVVVMSYPDLDILEKTGVERELTFPYIPGLLAFREVPVLLDAFSKLHYKPDLIFIDGQGLAHPRRFGIACHLGLLLNKPTIGCAKSRLLGQHKIPGRNRGDSTDLFDEEGRVLGAVVRTRDRTTPIYISIGHKIDLPTSIHYVLACNRVESS